MLAAIFAFSYGVLLFALVAEAQTQWLQWAGIGAAVWMIISGALVGYKANQ
jgi:hypothetical protein